jgi:hypothetical protein
MSLVLRKCLPDWLSRAISATKDPLKVGRMLTLNEFITHTEFKVDEYSMNKFYYNLDNEIPIYADKSMIEWFGYKGSYQKQKTRIKTLLQTNFSEYENIYWFDYTNEEYENYYNQNLIDLMRSIKTDTNKSDVYPNPTEFNGHNINKTKHLIIHPMIFKHIVLMADTQKSMEIRDYYITLEDLIKKYTQYQAESVKIKNKSLEQIIQDNHILINRIDNRLEEEKQISTDERKKAGDARDKLDIVVNKLEEVCTRAIPKDTPDGDKTEVWIIRDKASDDGDFNLYPIRGQKKSMKKTISELKKKWGEELTITYKIEQPNAIIFWTLIKKTYSQNIEKCTTTSWFKLNNISLNKFKREMNKLDESRLN